jgi:hypothetical protein
MRRLLKHRIERLEHVRRGDVEAGRAYQIACACCTVAWHRERATEDDKALAEKATDTERENAFWTVIQAEGGLAVVVERVAALRAADASRQRSISLTSS